jgi:hypothetical protein
MRAFSTVLAALWLALGAVAASAQQDLEPGVQTSSAAAPTTSPASTPGAAAGARATSGPANSKPRQSRSAPLAAGDSAPASANAPASAAPASGNAPASAKATPAPSAVPKAGKSSDRIELDVTQISGNRELPKVMYVVPWRRADPGDFTGRPLNSLLDEALTPVDRDVFRRQNRYYSAIQGGAGSFRSQPAAAGEGSAAPTPQDEK